MSKENLFDEFPPVTTEEWEKVIKRDLKGADYKEKLKWETGEGIEALPFYRKEDRNEDDEQLLPADHEWNICQLILESDISTANKTAKNAINGGADALTFHTELQSVGGTIGADMRGVAVQSQDHFSQLLDGIDLKETELHFSTGMLSPVFMGMLANEAEKRDINPNEINGTFGYDPFSFILKHGRFPINEHDFEQTFGQIIEYCKGSLAKMRPLQINGELFNDAGASIAQELGYALAIGSEYLAISGKDAASALHFNFGVSGNYFLEIAKLRAARTLWTQILEAYEAEQTEMFIHGVTADWNKSATDPYTNIIRETTEAMSAAIGGCNTITVQPFDAVQNEPNEFSNRIARNTQLILKEEGRFDKVSDPAAGSWYIETLTDKIAEAAWSVFQEMEAEGGLLQSIKEGTLQTAITKKQQKRAASLKNEEQIFVGVNKYFPENEADIQAISSLHQAVSMNETDNGGDIDPSNIIPSIQEALQNGAAMGDIVPALFDVGKLQTEPIEKYRIADAAD